MLDRKSLATELLSWIWVAGCVIYFLELSARTVMLCTDIPGVEVVVIASAELAFAAALDGQCPGPSANIREVTWGIGSMDAPVVFALASWTPA